METEIQYAASQIINRLDELAINDLLRFKLILYIQKSFESEEELDKLYIKRNNLKNIHEMSMFELGCGLNRIMVEINQLEMQYNQIVREIKSRNEKLNDDPNLKILKEEIKNVRN